MDITFHDLRGTAVTRLAEAGCTEAEIASITGHSVKSVGAILDRYLARTKIGFVRYREARKEQKVNRFSRMDSRMRRMLTDVSGITH